jgi:hypothetical protein
MNQTPMTPEQECDFYAQAENLHRAHQVCGYRFLDGLWLHAQICLLNCENNLWLPPTGRSPDRQR